MEKYEKLVRDRIPEILDTKGISYEKKVASPEEYKVELLKKITEEVAEFTESNGDIKELADILEVVDALKKLPEYAMVEDIQRVKREEKGSFDQKFIVKGEK
jgi:predicted house-cleaning noncanonical NTP pyrophosphatase (MazG superfamily)